MDERRTVEEVARQLSVGLLLVDDGAVRWLNDAARELVEPHGGSWTGSADLLDLLATVPAGADRTMVNWTPPHGEGRWWRVTCHAMAPPGRGLLYELVDRLDGRNPESSMGVATAHWRLDRLEALARMGSWVWDVAADRLEWSEALLDMFGLPSGSVLDFAAFRRMVHPDDNAIIDRALTEGMATGEPFSYTHRMYRADGVERIYECHGEVQLDAERKPLRVLGTARDVTEAHRARVELAYLAEHDPLTGIANRRRITNRLAECAADPAGATLLLIDIDHFKDINDLRGHAVGDRVIRRIAELVAVRLGAGALLGRLGGDEFAAVLPRCDPEHGLALGEKLCDAVAGHPMVESGPPLRATVSIGVTGVPGSAQVEVALAQADLALYEAKNAGRNRARLFTPDQYRQAKARVGLLQRVADALDSDLMGLDAQPIVDLATNRATRYEVLIRLRDGRHPSLGPADFLPPAETSDLVLRLDRWVLDRAVRALARARALHLEVNISARSLEDDDLGAWILHRLDTHGVEPGRLGLEITETTAITNVDAARRLVGRLTRAGCGFSLDDFGAGFGSFSHLKNLPFTAVKIAGEFVRQLDIDRVDRALVSAVVGVAEELGMRTVAEQVDRAPLIAHLRNLGIDDGQGYLLGRPRPLTELL